MPRGRRLRVKSRQQQRFVWGVLVKTGKVTATRAKQVSKKGRAYKKLPKRVRRKKK